VSVSGWLFSTNSADSSIRPQGSDPSSDTPNGTLWDTNRNRSSLHTRHISHTCPHFQNPPLHTPHPVPLHTLPTAVRHQNPKLLIKVTIWNFLFFLSLKLGRLDWFIYYSDSTAILVGRPRRGRSSRERYRECFSYYRSCLYFLSLCLSFCFSIFSSFLCCSSKNSIFFFTYLST
jgi:hypothetical protein